MKRLLCFLFAVMLASPVPAHDGATGIIKERMDAMKALGALTKTMADKIKGNRNLSSLAQDAREIAAVADRIPGWFPPGSTQAPTEAAPAIWTSFADFQAKSSALKAEADSLAALASTGDPAAISTQFRAVAASCKSCHESFRVKK
jgi:cytochrome c556